MQRVSTRHHQSDRSECYQVAHNQYTESKINRRRTFSLFAFIEERVSSTYEYNVRSLHPKLWVWQEELESKWPSTDHCHHIEADDRPGAQYLSPSIHHNGEFVVNPQRCTMCRVVEGAGEICQLEWTGRSRGCGQKHSDTLSSEPDKKYLQTMIRWWD